MDASDIFYKLSTGAKFQRKNNKLHTIMPVDITKLTEGWLELESDPGLFMLLLEDFGVKNVQVEEIYDITKPFDGPVYGFIFLFRWIEERRSRRKLFDQNDMFLKEEEVVNNIFFAQQMVPNSCATHALLSVLLNCPKIHLGDTLSRLKAHTMGMTPENKGWAIGNTPELARAHNSHAMPQAKRCVDKSTASAGVTSSRYAGEAFHFVSYVPIQDRLFELDGLKPYPIDHGPCDNDENWTEKFRKVMTERLGVAGGEPCHDIRFNLMALIPDRRIALSHKLNMLKTNREIVVTALQQLVHLNAESKKSEIKEDEKEAKDSSDLCSNSSLTESEAAMINDLKLEKVMDEEICEKSDEVSIKSDPAGVSQFSEDVTVSPNISSELTITTNHIDALSNIKSNLEASSKENIAPTFKIDKKVSMCVNSTDYTTPLTIETSPIPSISGTDTSSDIGSAFNSPLALGWSCNSCQNSPYPKDYKKFVMQVDDKNESPTGANSEVIASKKSHLPDPKKEQLKTPEKSSTSTSPEIQSDKNVDYSSEDTDAMTTLMSKYPVLREPHTFAPKDLLALLKNVETEIANCEASLKDENDKRTKYKIDDCRRTHNYDEFICTFLSMLAEQGKLADLVEQHLHKRPGLPSHRVKKSHTIKKSENKTSTRRRKGKTKHRRRNTKPKNIASNIKQEPVNSTSTPSYLVDTKEESLSDLDWENEVEDNYEIDKSEAALNLKKPQTLELLKGLQATDFGESKGELRKKKKSKKTLDNEALQKQEKEKLAEIRNKLKISVIGKNTPWPLENFEDLTTRFNVSPVIVKNLASAGYVTPTPIQAQTIPTMLEGRQVLGCAPTGSGKTAAFLIPIFHHLKKPKKKGFRCVIVCPTRELARQTYREGLRLSDGTGLRINIISKISHAIEKFNPNNSKKFDILITTPNRLVYLLKQEPPMVELKNVEWLIVDESDKLFETGIRGFRDQLAVIYNACDSAIIKRAMFSATQTPHLTKWCRKNLKNLVLINVGVRNSAVNSVKQELLFVGNEAGKLVAFRNLVNEGLTPPVLVFVQSKERAQELFNELVYDGINVDVIHSDRTQKQRDNVIRSFREGKIWVLICTELMGRGIDFKGVQLVVNYDFPPSSISYIHRIGRTGRAGREGRAITYFTQDDTVNLRSIARLLKDSGCEVPDYMLTLKKSNKNDKKKLEKKAPYRDSISTTPIYQKEIDRKRKNAIRRSKREKRRKLLTGETSN